MILESSLDQLSSLSDFRNKMLLSPSAILTESSNYRWFVYIAIIAAQVVNRWCLQYKTINNSRFHNKDNLNLLQATNNNVWVKWPGNDSQGKGLTFLCRSKKYSLKNITIKLSFRYDICRPTKSADDTTDLFWSADKIGRRQQEG